MVKTSSQILIWPPEKKKSVYYVPRPKKFSKTGKTSVSANSYIGWYQSIAVKIRAIQIHPNCMVFSIAEILESIL